LAKAKEDYASNPEFKEKAKQRAAKYYKENPDKVKESAMKSHENNREQKKIDARRNRLWRFFRLTPEDYESIKKYQEEHFLFRCLIGKDKKRNAVEHRHKDGLVRGLMAVILNRAYGIIERLYPNNTSEVLRALAEFHDNPPATSALGSPRYGILGISRSKKKMIYGSPDGPITAPKKVRTK